MLMGDKVLAEFTLDNNMNISVKKQYLYDANQELVGHIANGKTYFYLKNAQGDITAVINEEGLCVEIYNYSAWGKELDAVTPDLSNYTNDVNGAKLGSRIDNYYRGYEYAEGLTAYYLQSRYYDCYWLNRFINADVPQIAQKSKNEHYGLNLFAYCADNPVMFSDPSGYDNETWTIAAVITEIFVCWDLQKIAEELKISFKFNNLDEYKRIKQKIYKQFFDENPLYMLSNKLSTSSKVLDSISKAISLFDDYVPEAISKCVNWLAYGLKMGSSLTGRYLSPWGAFIMMYWDTCFSLIELVIVGAVSTEATPYGGLAAGVAAGWIYDEFLRDYLEITAYSWYLGW